MDLGDRIEVDLGSRGEALEQVRHLPAHLRVSPREQPLVAFGVAVVEFQPRVAEKEAGSGRLVGIDAL